MSKYDKLLARLLSQPTDFTWDELLRVLRQLGYEEQAAGKTGGSRRAFVKTKTGSTCTSRILAPFSKITSSSNSFSNLI